MTAAAAATNNSTPPTLCATAVFAAWGEDTEALRAFLPGAEVVATFDELDEADVVELDVTLLLTVAQRRSSSLQ